MSLDQKEMKRFSKKAGVLPIDSNMADFRKSTARLKHTYSLADTEYKTFIRRCIAEQIQEGQKLIDGRKMNLTERNVMRKNIESYKEMLAGWFDEVE